MSLTSFSFLIFVTLTLIVYFIVPKRIQWLVLLAASMYFLFYNNLSLVTVLQALIIFASAYIFGRLIDKYQGKKKGSVLTVVGVILILSVLVYLKYTNLFIITINHIRKLFSLGPNLDLVTRTSLVGLSYYSLIMISYLIDIQREACKAEKNPFKLALFMSYFPILSSGPFVKYKDMKSELFKRHPFSFEAFRRGLLRICWGLFKILVISQRINYFVNTVYGNMTDFNGSFAILAALLFPIQLYTNFSGSIDMIMGVSEIMSIELPENFTSPFFSKSITEFWRNWHITLGAWLKDYVFYPLLKSNFMQALNKKSKKLFGKKIGKKIPLYLSMLIMWIIIGIWHGGFYTYIIGSGLLQFVWIFLEDNLEELSDKVNKKIGIKKKSFGYRLYQGIRTYILFAFSMIFFRATSISDAIAFIKGMFVWNPWVLLDNKSIYTAGLDMLDFRVLIIAIIVLFVVDYFSKKFDVRKRIFRQNIVFRWIIIYALIFSIIIFGCYGVGFDPADFIYRGF